jgi:hypothetical protein
MPYRLQAGSPRRHQPRIVSHGLQQRMCYLRQPRPSQPANPAITSLADCSDYGCEVPATVAEVPRLGADLGKRAGTAAPVLQAPPSPRLCFTEMAIRDRFEDNAQVL